MYMYFISHSRKPVAHSNKQIAAQGAWHRPSPAVARTSQSPTCRPAWHAQRRARGRSCHPQLLVGQWLVDRIYIMRNHQIFMGFSGITKNKKHLSKHPLTWFLLNIPDQILSIFLMFEMNSSKIPSASPRNGTELQAIFSSQRYWSSPAGRSMLQSTASTPSGLWQSNPLAP